MVIHSVGMANEKAIENVKAHISIRTYDDQIYSAKLRVLSLLEMTKRQGVNTRNCLVLFADQLRNKSVKSF